MILIVISARGTIPKILIKELEDLEISEQVKNIMITVELRSTEILRRELETWGDFVSLKLQWETIS